MRFSLVSLVFGAIYLGLSTACGIPYDGRDLTFADTNHDGNCDTVSFYAGGYGVKASGVGGIETYNAKGKLEGEMTQEQISRGPRFNKAKNNGAQFYFPNDCGAPRSL